MGETGRDLRKCQGRLCSYPQDGQLGWASIKYRSRPIAPPHLSDFLNHFSETCCCRPHIHETLLSRRVILDARHCLWTRFLGIGKRLQLRSFRCTTTNAIFHSSILRIGGRISHRSLPLFFFSLWRKGLSWLVSLRPVANVSTTAWLITSPTGFGNFWIEQLPPRSTSLKRNKLIAVFSYEVVCFSVRRHRSLVGPHEEDEANGHHGYL